MWHIARPTSWHIPITRLVAGDGNNNLLNHRHLLMNHPVLHLISLQLTLKFKFNRIIVECDMIVVATGPVASVGVNSWYHFSIIEIRASSPKCVAQVTNQRTISLRRQFRQVNVIRITCRPSSKATDNRILLRELASVVAYRKASWAN